MKVVQSDSPHLNIRCKIPIGRINFIDFEILILKSAEINQRTLTASFEIFMSYTWLNLCFVCFFQVVRYVHKVLDEVKIMQL